MVLATTNQGQQSLPDCLDISLTTTSLKHHYSLHLCNNMWLPAPQFIRADASHFDVQVFPPFNCSSSPPRVTSEAVSEQTKSSWRGRLVVLCTSMHSHMSKSCTCMLNGSFFVWPDHPNTACSDLGYHASGHAVWPIVNMISCVNNEYTVFTTSIRSITGKNQ